MADDSEPDDEYEFVIHDDDEDTQTIEQATRCRVMAWLAGLSCVTGNLQATEGYLFELLTCVVLEDLNTRIWS